MELLIFHDIHAKKINIGENTRQGDSLVKSTEPCDSKVTLTKNLTKIVVTLT